MKDKRTKVIENEFKGKPMFSIYEVDEDDKPIEDVPLFICGMVKAKLIKKHLEELEDYIDG
jgi:hypothetical protein